MKNLQEVNIVRQPLIKTEKRTVTVIQTWSNLKEERIYKKHIATVTRSGVCTGITSNG